MPIMREVQGSAQLQFHYRQMLSWPSWVVYFVTGPYLGIWSVWMHQILRTFPKRIAEYGDERNLKAQRQVILEGYRTRGKGFNAEDKTSIIYVYRTLYRCFSH